MLVDFSHKVSSERENSERRKEMERREREREREGELPRSQDESHKGGTEGQSEAVGHPRKT